MRPCAILLENEFPRAGRKLDLRVITLGKHAVAIMIGVNSGRFREEVRLNPALETYTPANHHLDAMGRATADHIFRLDTALFFCLLGLGLGHYERLGFSASM